MKIEAAQKVPNALFRRPGRQPLQVQEGAGVKIQGFQLMLSKVAYRQVISTCPLPG